MNTTAGLDFQQLFESVPGLYLILRPDFSIVAVSDAYLAATMTSREQILGRPLFEVFPDNPDDPAATGVSNLRDSLNYVLKNKEAHTMAVQQYDIRRPDGSFEVRYWSPLNKPVLNKQKEITHIIHRVEDITLFIQLKKEEARQLKLTEELRGQLEEKAMEGEKSQQELEASQRMFSTIFYQSPVMNTIADAATGKYIEVNDNFARFCGLTKEEIVGKSSPELNLMPQFLQRAELIDRIKSDGYALDVLLQAIDRNGHTRWISTSAHMVNINGKDCFLTAMIDVTERRNSEEKIKFKEELISRQKQEIQDFIDSMSTLCAKVSTEGRLLMVNKIAREAAGQPMEELLGANFLEGRWWAYDDEVQARVKEAFAKARQGIPVNYDENIFVFGRVIPINFSLTPIGQSPQEVEYIVAEGRDISSLKKTEAALQKQTEELETSNKELEAFSYSVSHDLRAPLRIMHGYTEIIISDYSANLEEEGKRMLGIVTNNVRKMGQLIDDLLNLSRFGRKELVFQPINMNKLVESVIAELNITEGPKPLIRVGRLYPSQSDSSLMRQVWINLISNAVKYSRTREQPVIEIGSVRVGHEIIYSVKDNGVGFNMKYVHKLFGVFQRLHKANEFEGTGVGLALVHRIMHRLGGRVWGEAELDKGAIFRFSLPDPLQAISEDQKNGIINGDN